MLATFLCVLLAAPPVAAGLDGSWVVADDGGENPVRPSGHAKGSRWSFDDESSKFVDDPKGGTDNYYRLSMAGGVKTIAIDSYPKGMWNGGPIYVQRGVYAITGDRLRIYLAPPGEEQPKAFPKAGGPAQYRVLVLERVKK
jgi:hypothetical protein